MMENDQQVIASGRNITFEELLPDTAGHLEAIIQFLPEGLVLYSPEGEILRFNPAADALLGYPPEVKGLSLSERYPFIPMVAPSGEDMSLERFPVARALRGETVQAEVIGYNRQDGHFLWQDLPHIFERFYRVRGTSGQGLGLGLFIARSLVEANGGRLWAESEPGRGSIFYLSLPISQGSV